MIYNRSRAKKERRLPPRSCLCVPMATNSPKSVSCLDAQRIKPVIDKQHLRLTRPQPKAASLPRPRQGKVVVSIAVITAALAPFTHAIHIKEII